MDVEVEVEVEDNQNRATMSFVSIALVACAVAVATTASMLGIIAIDCMMLLTAIPRTKALELKRGIATMEAELNETGSALVLRTDVDIDSVIAVDLDIDIGCNEDGNECKLKKIMHACVFIARTKTKFTFAFTFRHRC